jgi:pyruvate formate lyase activating enzyme
MIITALTKFSAIDFPGRLACILFTGGCNFRCGFCHNAEFVLPEKLKELTNTIPFETVLNFLGERRGLLDGVSICGGEPTINPDLPEKMREIKNLGFEIKLDTNGSNPAMLEKIIDAGLVDYLAMDIKDALPYRQELVGVEVGEVTLRQSIALIKKAGQEKDLDYEFRSTILPAYHDLDTLRRMGDAIAGAKKWVLQGFRPGKTLREGFRDMTSFEESELGELTRYLSVYADKLEFRPG